MPSTLTPEELSAALQALPAWTVRGDALTRAVTAPAGAGALLRSVEQLAEQLQHSPAGIGIGGDTVSFRLKTGTAGSAGGVTELDVELAARIDQVLSGSHATGTDPGHR